MRVRKRGVGLSGVVSKVRNALRKIPPETLRDISAIAKIALSAAHRAVRGAGGKSNIMLPKVLVLPKKGGILPLLPILGALGGVGSLAGGISGLIKVIRDIKSGSSLKRIGRYHVKRNRKGYGLYLQPYKGPYPYSGIESILNRSRN